MAIGRIIRLRVLGAALATTLATGCGAGAEDQPDETGQTADSSDAVLEFSRCMRDNGVDIPDPKIDADGQIVFGDGEDSLGGATQEQYDAARKECEPLLMSGANNSLPGTDLTQADKEKMLDFARCMREQGIEMPDPSFDEGPGISFQVPQGAKGDANFEDASRQCQSILGTLGETP